MLDFFSRGFLMPVKTCCCPDLLVLVEAVRLRTIFCPSPHAPFRNLMSDSEHPLPGVHGHGLLDRQ